MFTVSSVSFCHKTQSNSVSQVRAESKAMTLIQRLLHNILLQNHQCASHMDDKSTNKGKVNRQNVVSVCILLTYSRVLFRQSNDMLFLSVMCCLNLHFL